MSSACSSICSTAAIFSYLSEMVSTGAAASALGCSAAGAAAVSLILSRVDQKATVDAFAAQQSGRLALAREILGAQLRRVSSDAAYLSRLDSRNNAPAAALADPAGELARHLAVFIESHEVYDQLRVLSADGRFPTARTTSSW
mgnify:CR=1 FL=1